MKKDSGYFSAVSFPKKRYLILVILFFSLLVINHQLELYPLHPFKNNDYNEAELKVFALNVCCFGNHYKKRQIEIAQTVLNANPDVVFLCEFWLNKSRQLDSILTKDYKRFYKSGTNCVFYSKLEMDSIKDVFAEMYSKRYSQTVMTHVFKGNDTLTIVGCHLSSSHHHIKEGYKKREKEADELYEQIKCESYPVIVVGDLNDISGSYVIQRIQKAGLADAWWEAGCGYGSTFHDGLIRLRLDHILYPKGELKLKGISIIDNDMSDHNALVAGFDIKKKETDL